MPPNSKSSSATSGKKDANSNAIKELRAILKDEVPLFACGGMIPIAESNEELTDTSSSGRKGKGKGKKKATAKTFKVDEQNTSLPVTIRWDLEENDESQAPCTKVTLPLAPGTEADIERLVQHSEPATFGRGSKDVYDESYRKALKMDTTKFSSTFDPYSLGIIDTVAQVLLPSVIDSTTHRAVRAELYKLNVYSAPSGKFKPHVDTPRSSSQFGSLVVCLPVDHEGGQLQVRHKGSEMTFDWSTSGNGKKQAGVYWAAFYSDCEHEVLEVTSGHRLTLTYNLYAVRGAGRLTGVSPTLDPTQLPLFQAIKNIVGQDPFNGQGGTLGFWCSHAYAYNNKSEAPMPDTLKGIDAVLWESLQSLKLHPRIAPVLTRDDMEDLQDYYEYYERDDDSDTDEDENKTSPAAKRRKTQRPPEMPSKWVIGRDFQLHVDTSMEVEGTEEYNKLYQSWGETVPYGTIKWLTDDDQNELQMVYVAVTNTHGSSL
ncbi:hypothetical protein F5884DRAFT_749366 [Xylogone sp. PMI_703]|nr:hypothetical protein F5884DRAFT_749366 [Xylogone sp. PMI_703]